MTTKQQVDVEKLHQISIKSLVKTMKEIFYFYGR